MAFDELKQDLDALVPGHAADGASRRTALHLMLGAGYAAAAAPVMAQTAIQTPAQGLLAGMVQIDVGGFQMPAYRAAPEGRGNLPVVLEVQEIFGVHE